MKRNQEVYSNHLGRAVLYYLDRKYSQDSFWTRLRRSCCKRMFELSLRPILEDLKQEEEDYKNLIMNGTLAEMNPIFNYEGKEIKFFLPLFRYDLIQQFISKNRTFFEVDILKNVKAKYLRPHMTYLDCGANIGNHSVFFCKNAEAKKIYAFEGNPDTYLMLDRNIRINGLTEKVESFNCVLGEKEGKAKIDDSDPLNIGGTSFHESDEGVPMKCLDDFCFNEKIDFVKMDVEGFEYLVLKGMKRILQKDKPILWIEIFSRNQDKVKQLLGSMNYKLLESLSGTDYIFCHTECNLGETRNA